MKTTVALIWGGCGKEHDVSCMGYPYVLALLKKVGYTVISVYIDRQSRWYIVKNGRRTPTFPIMLSGKCGLYTEKEIVEIDVALPLLHGDRGESGEIQGLLDAAGIKYVGADVPCGALCLDKSHCKCVADTLGIPSAKWQSFSRPISPRDALKLCLEKFPFPMFIKPRRLGSSVGAYVARNEEEFIHSFERTSQIENRFIMVEELIESKRELECAFYSAKGTTFITRPGEILLDGFYGYDEKYKGNTQTDISAKIDTDTWQMLQKYSLILADEIGLRHLARIDFFLTDKGLLFNEINTLPGFTHESLYPKMIEAAGIPPEIALKDFIEDALGC